MNSGGNQRAWAEVAHPCLERFQILSLDGGGVKGLFAAAILAFFEDDCKCRVSDHFDLIAGTSTGGIIALALGMGMRPREIVEFYRKHGPRIFRNELGQRSLLRIFHRKFSSLPLQKALQDCFKEKTLADSTKRLVIPAYNLDDDNVYVFKTRHHQRLMRDHRVEMWKVGMATTAAPTYFRSFSGVDGVRLIDGGVWANNPTMVAIAEAHSVLGVPLSSIHVMSIGTTEPIVHRKRRLDAGGLLAWCRSAPDVLMKGQSVGTNNQAIHLLGKEKVFRVDVRVPEGVFALDKPAIEALFGKAAGTSREVSPRFELEFRCHVAAAFAPIRTKSEETINVPDGAGDDQ